MPVLCASAKPMEAPNKAEIVPAGMAENNMVTQALAIVEKKVRNLEKRKVRKGFCLKILSKRLFYFKTSIISRY